MRKNYLQYSADENSSCDTSESSPADVKEQTHLPPCCLHYLKAVVLKSRPGASEGSLCFLANNQWHQMDSRGRHAWASLWGTVNLVLVLGGTYLYGICPHSALLPLHWLLWAKPHHFSPTLGWEPPYRSLLSPRPPLVLLLTAARAI